MATLSVLRALQTRARDPRCAKYFNASNGIWEQLEYKEPQPYTLPCPGCIPGPGSGRWMRQEPGLLRAGTSWVALLVAPSSCFVCESFRFRDCLLCEWRSELLPRNK